MSFLTINHLLPCLQAFPAENTVWIAFSGGLDSQVLLHLAAQCRPDITATLRAVHVHHGLQVIADGWVVQCEQWCKALEIPLTVRKISVEPSHGDSVEAIARAARYAALREMLKSGDGMLTAHHADDQSETLLLQLLRGAGVDGLAAMPMRAPLGNGWLLRPLLTVRRDTLHNYAVCHGLHWIDDPSNDDERFGRNFLRHQVLPLLRERWPGLDTTLGRAARHQAQAAELLKTLAAQDMKQCRGGSVHQLSIPALQALPVNRQQNLLRYWLRQQHFSVPSTVRLQQIMDTLLTASEDRQPCTDWGNVEVRRYQQQLYAMSRLPARPSAGEKLSWTSTFPLKLALGHLSARKVYGRGLRLLPGKAVTVRYRQGGEKGRWRGHLRSLKTELQQMGIVPWLRPFLPLIYSDETLIWAAGSGPCDDWQAYDMEESWHVDWSALDT